ncbi:hypothetical protein STEG23_012533 [Scotinomys teguina]
MYGSVVLMQLGSVLMTVFRVTTRTHANHVLNGVLKYEDDDDVCPDDLSVGESELSKSLITILLVFVQMTYLLMRRIEIIDLQAYCSKICVNSYHSIDFVLFLNPHTG